MRLILLLLIGALVVMVSSCSLGVPNPGFTIVTVRRNALGIESPLRNILVNGRLVAASDNASGTRTTYSESSGVSGQIPVDNGRAPGLWANTEENGPCAGQTDYCDIHRGEVNYLICERQGFGFHFDPSSINADAPPATFSITGSGMNAVYDMPTVQFRNYTGTLVAKIRATSLTEGRITANTTALRSLSSGTYTAQVWNATASGAGKLVGTATMRVYRPQPPPNPCDAQHIQTDDGQQIDIPAPCN